jgi:hypothetical protein
MTDKVQKIREEVERLRVEVMGIRTDFADGQKSVLTKLLAYIDSLQEEPKPKFHIGDTIRHKEEKDTFKVFAIEDDCSSK